MKLAGKKIPFFNAPIYLRNETQNGKVDEIFGSLNELASPPLLNFSFRWFGFTHWFPRLLLIVSPIITVFLQKKLMKGILATLFNQGDKILH